MDMEILQKAQQASRLVEPADLHGMVCGLAIAFPQAFSLPELVDLAGTDALEDSDTLQDFVGAVLDQLHAQDLEFTPLIADDEEPLAIRLGELAAWCGGFLSGFGAGLKVHSKELPDEVQEIVRDFASICQLDEEEVETEQNEASFMELYEYVRVGAVLSLALMYDFMENQTGAESDDDPDGVVH